jgi:tetratricopeptide (TPR) repeat protein
MTEYSSDYLFESNKATVERFEEMLETRKSFFFDVEEIEVLTDYYLEKGNHAKARKAVAHGLTMHPDSSAIMLKKAQTLLFIKEPEKALRILNFLEAAEPMNTEMLLFKAMVHRNLSDHEGTKSCLLKALNSAPENREEIFLDLAFEQEMVEDYDGAIMSLMESLEINPNHEASLFELGYCFDMAQDFERGIEYFAGYIDKHPYSFVAWYNLALCYEKLGLFEKAQEAVNYCTAIEEDFTNGHILLGNICTTLDDDLGAISAYNQALESDDENPMIYAALGECYERLGELNLSEINYKKALELEENYVDAIMGMGALMDMQNSAEACLNYYDQAVRIDELDGDNWHIYAEACIRHDRMERAENVYREMLKHFPDDEDAYIGLAELLASKGELAEAIETVQDGLGLIEQAIELPLYLIKFLYLSGRSQEASQILIASLSVNENSAKLFLDIFPEAIKNQNIASLIEIYTQADREDEL